MKPVKVIHMDEVAERTPPGGGGAWRRLISNEETETGMILGYGLIQPGDGRGWHKHPPGEDETFFVIEGEARVEWKEENKTHQKLIGAGSAFYTPGDMENNVTNVGNRPLKAIFGIVKPQN